MDITYTWVFVTLALALSVIQISLGITNQGATGATKNVDDETDASLVDDWINRKNTPESLTPKSDLNETSTKKGCQCVKYYMCNSVSGGPVNKTHSLNETQAEDPQEILGVVDIRRPNSTGTELKVTNGGCKHYFEVCCTVSNFIGSMYIFKILFGLKIFSARTWKQAMRNLNLQKIQSQMY